MTTTRTMDTSTLPATLKERNLARLHHAANGAVDDLAAGAAGAAVAVAVAVVVAGAVGAVDDLATGAALGAALSAAVGGAAATAVGGGAATAVGDKTQKYRGNIPEREQTHYQRIGAACLLSFALAAGVTAGSVMYDKVVKDLENQKTRDVAPAPSLLEQQFSISNSGEGDCVIVVPKSGASRVVRGNCTIELK